MSKQTGVTFGELIGACERHGFEYVIEALEKAVYKTECLQAELYSGDAKQVKQAQKLSRVIIKQNETIIKLKLYQQNKGGEHDTGAVFTI